MSRASRAAAYSAFMKVCQVPSAPMERRHHVHFFFDTVPISQAGSPGEGPWQLYPASYGAAGTSPFTLLGPSEKPQGAQELCILVANPNHSIIPGTGNCKNLPS